MNNSNIKAIVIRRDGFRPSKPWSADVYLNDGEIFLSWCYGYRSKKSLVEYITDVRGDSVNIIRAPYELSIDTDNNNDAI